MCLKLQIFNKVRAQWPWHKYAMREAKQAKTGKKNGEKAIFLTLSLRSISCSVMQGTGFPCLNAHFGPYLYSRIVYILCHPCVLLLEVLPALMTLITCASGDFNAGFIKFNFMCTCVQTLVLYSELSKSNFSLKIPGNHKFTWFSWEVKVFSI